MRYMLSGLIIVLALVAVPVIHAQNSPVIVQFVSDRASITPDEAESGGTYTNLTWQTANLQASDSVYLQVLVSGAWHDITETPQAASGTLNWAIPHTLDFAPPTFRLEIRNTAGASVATQNLTIPYSAPPAPPAVTLFEVEAASLTPEQVSQPISVTWHVRNRPPRANVVFEQILDNGAIVPIDLPRPNQWVRSTGKGLVQPQPDGNSLTLRARLVNIDTAAVYAQRSVGVPVIGSPLPPSHSAAPDLTSFTARNYMPGRGDSVTVDWTAENADSVRVEVYDLNYFPRPWSPGPFIEFDDLPAAGSLDLVIPADYNGTGWQIHALARRSGIDSHPTRRIDLVFSDVPQPVLLIVDTFTASTETVRPGDRVTITWDTHVTTRTSEDGRVSYNLPVAGYEHALWLEVRGVVLGGVADGSPFDQRFTVLNTQGSLEVTIGDYDAPINGVSVVLGMEVHGQPISYDNIFLSLTQ